MSRFKQYQNLTLDTERLHLRVLDESAAPAVLDYHLRNKDFFGVWSPIPRPSFWTLKFQQEKLQQDQELLLEKRQVKLWVSLQKNPEVLIGHVNFSNIVWGGFLSCFLGYSMDERHNGKGYTTEALAEAVRFMFEQGKLHRVEANIIPRNKASIRVVEKLGFDCEGLSPKYLKINGIWEDHLHYVKRNTALEG